MADVNVGWVAPTVNSPGGRDRLLTLQCRHPDMKVGSRLRAEAHQRLLCVHP